MLPVSLYNEMHIFLLLVGIMEGKFGVNWKDFVHLVESSSRQSFQRNNQNTREDNEDWNKHFLVQSSTTGQHSKQIC